MGFIDLYVFLCIFQIFFNDHLILLKEKDVISQNKKVPLRHRHLVHSLSDFQNNCTVK